MKHLKTESEIHIYIQKWIMWPVRIRIIWSIRRKWQPQECFVSIDWSL